MVPWCAVLLQKRFDFGRFPLTHYPPNRPIVTSGHSSVNICETTKFEGSQIKKRFMLRCPGLESNLSLILFPVTPHPFCLIKPWKGQKGVKKERKINVLILLSTQSSLDYWNLLSQSSGKYRWVTNYGEILNGWEENHDKLICFHTGHKGPLWGLMGMKWINRNNEVSVGSPLKLSPICKKTEDTLYLPWRCFLLSPLLSPPQYVSDFFLRLSSQCYFSLWDTHLLCFVHSSTPISTSCPRPPVAPHPSRLSPLLSHQLLPALSRRANNPQTLQRFFKKALYPFSSLNLILTLTVT